MYRNKMIHTHNSGDALDGKIILLVCEISSRCCQDGRADCSRAGMTPSLIRTNGCLLQKAAVLYGKTWGRIFVPDQWMCLIYWREQNSEGCSFGLI
jgi:hypothetical protein